MNLSKICLIGSLILVFCFSPLFAGDGSSSRMTIDSDWTFQRGDHGAGESSVVSLPHSYNVEECMEGYSYYRGEALYSRTLQASELTPGKRHFIRFGSAALTAEVFLNGVRLGEHLGGYSAFIFELTPHLRYDSTDLVEVKVDNRRRGDVMPISGDFNIYGGLTRSVELIRLPATAISPMHYASGGIYIYPKEVSDEQARFDVVVRALSDESLDGRVELRLMDSEGVVVAKDSQERKIAAGESALESISMELDQPHLWDGMNDPYLYSLEVRLLDGSGALLDSRIEKTGFRFFHVDPAKGFFMNGKHLKLKGVNRHQDIEGRGAALLKEDHDLDMGIIKEMGTNALRLAHYQHDSYFYSLADREGMVVWAEIPFVSFALDKAIGAGKRKAFTENGKDQISEMIYQNFNHPSIIFWGIYNEIKNLDAPAGVVKKFNRHAKELDPHRISAGAANLAGPFNNITDVLAWNKYAGWYAGLPGTFTRWSDRYHKRKPERAFGISEYGAGASAFQHQTQLIKSLPGASWHPENWQCEYHEQYWKTIRERDFIWGSFIWNMFDFSAINRNEGDHKGRNDKGMVTYDRKIRKDVFYFYKASWSDEPVLYITQRRFTERNESEAYVKVYTNLHEAELIVNGVGMGIQKADDLNRIRWNGLQLNPGENKIEVRALHKGEKMTDSVVWNYSGS